MKTNAKRIYIAYFAHLPCWWIFTSCGIRSCRLVIKYRYFGGVCCFHLQDVGGEKRQAYL